MKRTVAAILAGVVAATAVPAAAGPICLDIVRIRSTTVPDAKHILFHMYDGTVWRNTLKNACPGLIFNGFVYAPTNSREVCENLETLRVIQDNEVCMLGSFTKDPPKTKTAS